MDFQGQMLAHAEYRLSNQLAHKAGRTELLDPRERRFRLPRVPTPAIWSVLIRVRTIIDGLTSRGSRKTWSGLTAVAHRE
jgi:hypothetical protein